MKVRHMGARCALALFWGLPTSTARRASHVGASLTSVRIDGAGAVVGTDDGEEGLKTSISGMVEAMIQGKGPKLPDIIATASKKLDVKEAVQQLDGKLPEDVASLVRAASADDESQHGQRQPLSESSMQRARRILNNMVSDAWLELDDVLFECKEFQERNRGTFEQVVNDLARLGSQLAGLGERRINAAAGIVEYDAQRKGVEEKLEAATQTYTETLMANQQLLTRRKNNLAVFDFVLNLTACAPPAFVQVASGSGAHAFGHQPQATLCNSDDGIYLNFNNPALQAKVERLMTPDARAALRAALEAGAGLDFVQLQGLNASATSTTMMAASSMPVQEGPHPDGQWKKCVDGETNCGFLHDLMSLEWGRFRDQLDRLTAEMKTNQADFDTYKNNINDQLTVIGDAKTKHMETLAQTISSINADTEEMNEKDEQKRVLTQEYEKTCAEFKDKITEILFTKMCAVKKVRNGLLVHSSRSPPTSISDCDVSDWESKTGQCFTASGQAIVCDDTCPGPDPYQCGGKELMKRDIVVSNNSFGVQCPPLERQKRCGQKKCPVACALSAWSGWSKCTKECEGGVQTKTRSVVHKPLNGGQACDSVQEERSCNTGSCDRDCTLVDWTEWAPCSMACGGGRTKRSRAVLVPIRGQGKCPKPRATQRLEIQECNTQRCIGDEICIAQQDLVIALDASGSLKYEGFQVLRQFAANLTTRYKAKYFGIDAARLGVVVFGNGQLATLPDGTTTVSPAMPVQPLTGDLNLVRSRIMAQQWQRGFTNMAQALTAADTLLSQGGRQAAQSAVLVLSDGKYSFKYQTAEKARELKDKNIMVLMAPVADYEGKDLMPLKRWASQPWQTNYEWIPGLEALEHNNDVFVQQLIAKFCPDSMSPSQLRQIENQAQYMLIHENGWPSDNCGAWFYEGIVSTLADCAALARARGLPAFAFGRTHAAGRCYSEAVAVTEAYWDQFSLDRSDPPCPSGTWLYNPFFDSYAINPRSGSVV